MKFLAFAYFLLFPIVSICAQEKPVAALAKIGCNCNSSIPLTVNPGLHYGPTEAPHLFGGVQEISTPDKNSEIAFHEEHNTAWYLLSINFDGDLSFVISPADTGNDYDFLLYPYKDTGFCKRLMNHTVTPVRGNLSCNIPVQHGGTTGLSGGALQSFHQQGPGESFSTSLLVKKGEKYMLVLDNVTPNGSGHTLLFKSLMSITINGTVVDSAGLPVMADVTMADPAGKTIEHTSTDSKGKYEIKASIQVSKNYSLTYYNDSSFIGTETINTDKLKASHTFTDIKTVLPKLKKGAKYPLGNINFYGNSTTLIPQSKPSVEALFHLMEKNKKLVIRLEGHVNAPNMTEREMQSRQDEFQNLSENRARAVRDYLAQRGIAFNRISIIGYAAKCMLFPEAKNEFEASANRRVEVKVLSLNGE